MKTKHLFFALLIVIAAVVASCSPAQVAAGKYNSTSCTYSAPGISSTSVSASITVSENGTDAVNIVVSPNGFPDMVVNNILLTRISVPGATQVSFDLNGDIDVSGAYIEAGGQNVLDLTVSNDIDTTYVSFTGKK